MSLQIARYYEPRKIEEHDVTSRSRPFDLDVGVWMHTCRPLGP